MVVVIGSVVKEANSAEELMSLFEEGSASRHIASTKMNAESSRSHLVLSIIIESTNLTSGAVTKGKVSLLDRKRNPDVLLLFYDIKRSIMILS